MSTFFEPAFNMLQIELTPPLSWGMCVCNGLAGGSMLLQQRFQGRNDLGWDPAPQSSRFLLLLVAIWFTVNAIIVAFEPRITLRVLVLSFLVCVWRVNELLEYRRRSVRHAIRNVEAARDSFDRLKARGRLPKDAVRP